MTDYFLHLTLCLLMGSASISPLSMWPIGMSPLGMLRRDQ